MRTTDAALILTRDTAARSLMGMTIGPGPFQSPPEGLSLWQVIQMKRLFLMVAILATPAALGCEGTTDPPPATRASLTVFVQFDDQGVPGKHIEVLENGLSRDTNHDGLAKFALPPGDYTVRAYGINVGGPSVQYIDTPVTVRAGRDNRVEIFDCLPCV